MEKIKHGNERKGTWHWAGELGFFFGDVRVTLGCRVAPGKNGQRNHVMQEREEGPGALFGSKSRDEFNSNGRRKIHSGFDIKRVVKREKMMDAGSWSGIALTGIREKAHRCVHLQPR